MISSSWKSILSVPSFCPFCSFKETKSVSIWEHFFFSGQKDTNQTGSKIAPIVLWSWKRTNAVMQLPVLGCFFFMSNHKFEDWRQCHTILCGNDVTSSRCLESINCPERGGKRALKYLTHDKRGERWGEEGEIWPICHFFHSIRAGYAKEKQV